MNKNIKKEIKDNGVEFIGFLSLDIKGKIHILTIPVKDFTDDLIENGLGFDASSYGFSDVENSDMVIKLDIERYFYDPFLEPKTLIFYTTIHYADKKRTRYENDPRYIALKIQKMLKKEGIADTIFMAPEYEFYLFRDVFYEIGDNYQSFEVESIEEKTPYKRYHVAPPDDVYFELRNSVSKILLNLGVPVKYHHHEVGVYGQQEIEVHFQPLLKSADDAVLVKYIVKNFFKQHGILATFMPKPFKNHPGSGLHIHQFLSKDGKNVFYSKNGYGNLSDTAMYYIGGILKNINSLVALTNPSTNSFKRLVPGFEAPTGINFGIANRNSAIRIPAYVNKPEKTRIEFRTPDFTCNPHIAFSAVSLAGIYGIKNKIDPVSSGFGPAEKKKGRKFRETVDNLIEALNHLEKNNEFLTSEGFSKNFIKKYVSLYKKEIIEIQREINPVEYYYYFNV